MERAKWAERQRAAELCRRTALRLLERSEPLARKTLDAAWLGATFAVKPLSKAAGECDKTSILLRKPQPLEIKSEKLAKIPLHTGDYDNPRMRSVFRDFEERGTVAHRATSTDIKTRNRVFRKKSLFRDFLEFLKITF